MLVELFLIPLLFIVFAGWGCWAKLLLSVRNESIAISVIAGLALYGLVACIIAFFIPLNIPVEIFLLVVAVIPYFLKNIRNHLPPIPKTILKNPWFWGFALMIILAGSYYTFRNDHFGYYVPTLNWLNRYGLIIGLANIDWIVGQTSFIHIIQAGIDQTIDPYGRFGIFFVILFLVYIFEKKSFLLLLFIPFYFLYFQSPSPDLPIVFFSLIVVNELCFHYKRNNFKILFIISVFAFVIKPTVFWLPLWVLIVTLYQDKSQLKSIRNYIFPSILVLVFLIKNVIATSTLFYPVTFTKINTYWLPDKQVMELSDQKAIAFTYDLTYDANTINSFSTFDKIYHWLTLPDLQTIMIYAILITLLFFGVFSFWKRRFIYIALFFVAIFKLIIVFSFSGQFRFMLDAIYPILFILLSSLNIKRLPVLSGSLVLFISALLFVSFPNLGKKILPSFKLTGIMVGFTKESLIRPENYPRDTYKQGKIGNLDFHTPINDFFIYETPPPAISKRVLTIYYEMGIFPQWKDPDCVRKGFYTRALSSEEKEALRKLIENLQQ